MVIRLSFFLMILLTSCRDVDKQIVVLDYDLKALYVENEMFFIEKVEIYNSTAKTLYKLRLKDGEVGQSKVFLFQNTNKYAEEGSLDAINNDSSRNYIQVEIHSRDKRKIEVFESPIDMKNTGKDTIPTMKDPFP